MSVNHAAAFVKRQDHTRDAFLGGKLSVFQPKAGFRAGLDSVLLGASLAASSRTVLDLGCGAGVAALVAMAHNPSLSAVLVDANEAMLAFASANAEANGLEARARTIALDVTERGSARAAAGLPVDHFTSVIANPPFFAAGRGTLPSDAGRAEARHMEEDGLNLWVRTAAASAAPGGEVIFIERIEALVPLLGAMDARFGSLSVLPIAARPGDGAGRVLVRGIKGSRAGLALLPALVLHGAAGNGFAPETDAIFRGEALLDWHNRRQPPK